MAYHSESEAFDSKHSVEEREDEKQTGRIDDYDDEYSEEQLDNSEHLALRFSCAGMSAPTTWGGLEITTAAGVGAA